MALHLADSKNRVDTELKDPSSDSSAEKKREENKVVKRRIESRACSTAYDFPLKPIEILLLPVTTI